MGLPASCGRPPPRWSASSRTASLSVSGLCGIPDVTTNRTDHDKARAVTSSSSSSAGGGAEGGGGRLRRGTSARTSSTSSSFFRIKNSYRKPRNSVRTSSTGSSSVASSTSSSSDFEDEFEGEDSEEGDDDVIELEDFGNMYINEEQSELFDEAILKQILSKTAPVKITLKLQVTESTFSVWETVLHKKTLYVEMPRVLLPEASKHSFMSVLEFAEERLECAQLVLHMRKTREDRQNLIRTFLFLGFQPLSPKSPFVKEAGQMIADEPSQSLFLMYTIEDDEEDEDESSSGEESLSEDE